MKSIRIISQSIGILIMLLFIHFSLLCQTLNRVEVDGQQLFLSGGNVAWIHFARDIGPGETRLDLFEEIFSEVSMHGGNTMRLWLHTTGAVTPSWDGHYVDGPGEGTIEDLRNILDLAHRHNVGMMLCLWSFDMLRISNGPLVTDRALSILTDESSTQSYIDNALIPMVNALAGHPAIIAWEIFNEAEGMSFEFGWEFTRHVPIHYIQKFVNLTAGAIRRTDPGALITNGAWSFRILSEKSSPGEIKRETAGPRKPSSEVSQAELEVLQEYLSLKYNRRFTLHETAQYYDQQQNSGEYKNYYSDEALINAGGDQHGYLDFYTVHYYTWGGTEISPFHHDAHYWELDKPVAVAEFYVEDMFGVPMADLYTVLYERGYAGALGWQWFDHWTNREGISHNWPNTLLNIKRVAELYPDDTRLIFRTPVQR